MPSFYDQFVTQPATTRKKGGSFYDQFVSSPTGQKGSFYDQFVTKSKDAEMTEEEKLARMNKANQSRIERITGQGNLPELQEYQQARSFWQKTKALGSGALDVLNRGEYMTGAAIDQMLSGGTPMQAATGAAKEVVSGMGVQGQKIGFPELSRKYSPEYKSWADAHPYASIATDLAGSIGIDWTTYTGLGFLTRGIKGTGKLAKWALKPLTESKAGEAVSEGIGKIFDPAYAYRKTGTMKAYDIKHGEIQYARSMRETLKDEVRPQLTTMAKYTPDEAEDFVLRMYGDKPVMEAVENIKVPAIVMKSQLKKMGLSETDAMNTLIKNPANKIKPEDWMRDNYFPVNMKQLTEFMQDVGEYSQTSFGAAGGLKLWKPGFTKGKKLLTGQDFLDFLYSKGVTKEDLPEIITKSIASRQGIHVSTLRNINMHNRFVTEMPEVFRKLPQNKAYKAWTKGILPGETPWMPAGNLRFFPQEIRDIVGNDIIEALNTSGGKITDDIIEKIDRAIEATTKTVVKTSTSGVSDTTGPLKKLELIVSDALEHRGMSKGEAMTYINKMKGGGGAGNLMITVENVTTVDVDRLSGYIQALMKTAGDIEAKITPKMMERLNKVVVSVSTRVPTYAVPVEIVDDLDTVSKQLGSTKKLYDTIDKGLQIWKNFAIFSPYFHVRNAVSSMFQNYAMDVNSERYLDMYNIMVSKSEGKIVSGKSIAEWRKLLKKHGGMSGSFIGQEVGEVSMLGKRIDIPFKGSRWVGTQIENMNRGALFIDQTLKNGGDYEKAMRKMWNAHFDYQEITEAERAVFRRMVPFYTWIRKNIPFQLERIMNAPKKYRNLEKLKQAIQGDAESENNPEWWKEQDVWMTKFQDKEGNKFALSVGLPYSDLNQISPSSMSRMAGSTGPAGSIYNLMANYNPFEQKNITEFSGQKEMGLPPKLKYAIESFVPIAKRFGFDVVEAFDRMGKDDPRGFYRLLSLTGIRIIPLTQTDEERNRVYKLLDELQQFDLYMKQEKERESQPVMSR